MVDSLAVVLQKLVKSRRILKTNTLLLMKMGAPQTPPSSANGKEATMAAHCEPHLMLSNSPAAIILDSNVIFESALENVNR